MADGQTPIEAPTDEKPTGLALLRAPFPANQISKLPKPTKKQTEDLNAAVKKGISALVSAARFAGDGTTRTRSIWTMLAMRP